MKLVDKILLGLTTLGMVACNSGATIQEPEFNVSFKNNYEICELTGNGTYKKGETATIEAAFNAGYKFEKWTMDGETFASSNPYSFTVNSDVELDVEYSLIDYYVYYDLNGGSLDTAKTKFNVITETFNLPTPTKTGYNFKGWTIKDTKDVIEKVKKGTAKDIYVVANWEAKTINVIATCDSNKGYAYGSDTYSYGERATLNATPKDGYKFIGWYQNNKKVSDDIVFYVVVYSDVTFEARFEAIVYYIAYDLDGGTLPEMAITSFTVETPTFKLPTPTKESGEFYDYEFVQWEDKKGAPIEEIEKGTIGDIAVTAKWNLVQKTCAYRLFTTATSWNYNSALCFEATTDLNIFRLRLDILEGDFIAVGDKDSYITNYDLESFGEFNAYVAGCFEISGSSLLFSVTGTYDIELNTFGNPKVLITIA